MTLKIAMAQINSTVGDLEENAEKIRRFIAEAKSQKANLVVFPELAITGYPPEDLLLENAFVERNKELLGELIEDNNFDIAGVIGFVDCKGKNLYNAAATFNRNKIVGVSYKTLLPTYDVFDEDRYFTPAEKEEILPVSIDLHGKEFKLGIEICEDLWDQDYDLKVTDLLARKGADLIVNISASPFHVGKIFERKNKLKKKSIKKQIAHILCESSRRTR